MATSGADVLKEFLVAIGFQIDASSATKMETLLLKTTAQAVALGTAMEQAAIYVVQAIARITSGMEQLYYASARTKSSVEDIQALGYAAQQMGSSASAAQSSLENLANFLRSSPAGAALINSLGVQTNGRSGTDILSDLGAKFAAMPIYRAQRYASLLGIDQNTLFALINGLGQLTQAYKAMYQAAGLDQSGGAPQARNFMLQLRALGAAFEILAIKVESVLSGSVGDGINRFRIALVDNFGNIAEVINIVAKAFEALAYAASGVITTAIHIFSDLFRLFQSLNPETKHLIEAIGGLALAWRALNIVFATSPLGRILMLAAALLLLYQDYETWKAGGKSLIDWSKWETDIAQFEAVLSAIYYEVNKVAQALGGWQTVFAIFLAYFTTIWVGRILGGFGAILLMIGRVGMAMAALGGGSAAAAGAGGAAAGTGILATAGGLLSRIALGGVAGLATYFTMPGSAPMAGIGQDYKFRAEGANPLEQQVRDALVTHYGWSQRAADGIVANLMAESGLDPTRVGDDGAAYGIGQWHADRQAAFARLFGHSIIGSSLGEQLAFMNAELRGQTSDAGARAAGQALGRSGETDQQAGFDVSTLSERPQATYIDAFNRASAAIDLGKRYPNVGGKSIVLNQQTTINAPGETANKLAQHQGRINQTLVRNLAGAIDRGH